MGVIRVTQSDASKNKVCYPFMKGNHTFIAFCPVWQKNNGTSFLPAGLKCIWKHDAGNEAGEWNTIRKWNTSKDTKTQTFNWQFGNSAPISWSYTSPYLFNMTNMTETIIKDVSNYAASGEKNVPLYVDKNWNFFSAARPAVVYPCGSNASRIYGIIPALASSAMGKVAAATAVFGAIVGVGSARNAGCSLNAYWYDANLRNTFSAFSETGNAMCSPGYSAWHVNGRSYHSNYYNINGHPSAQNPAWPTDNTIFTGVKYLGYHGGGANNLMFYQFTAKINSGTILLPPFYGISYWDSTSQTTKQTQATVYDQWIGIKT